MHADRSQIAEGITGCTVAGVDEDIAEMAHLQKDSWLRERVLNSEFERSCDRDGADRERVLAPPNLQTVVWAGAAANGPVLNDRGFDENGVATAGAIDVVSASPQKYRVVAGAAR